MGKGGDVSLLRCSRFTIEVIFVLTILVLIKYEIAPLLFSWLVYGEQAWHLLLWSHLIFGLLVCFVYLGFGSISKQVYTLRPPEAIGCYLAVHLPLLFPSFPVADYWQGLFTDAWYSFAPQWTLGTMAVFWFSAILFWSGRCVRIVEENRPCCMRKCMSKSL